MVRKPSLSSPVCTVIGVLLLLGLTGCGQDDNRVSPPPDPVAYTNADGIRGGQLYDKFWAVETGWDQTDPNLTTYNGNADFFRCKQCHGWDLLASAGAYISRGPKDTRPNVSPSNLKLLAADKSPQELFDALKRSTGRRAVTVDLSTYDPATNPTVGDQMPDYGSILTDAQLWDLVRFLKVEVLDVDDLYDSQTTGTYPTGSIAFSDIGKDGSATNGDAIYSERCVSCHGADGTAFLVDGDSFTVGSHLRAKPYEGHHKIKFGQLGSDMESLVTTPAEMKDLYKALADEAKYPDPQ